MILNMDESYYNWSGSKLFENKPQKPTKNPYYEKPVEKPIIEKPVEENPFYDEPIIGTPLAEKPIEAPVLDEIVAEDPPKQPVIIIPDSQDGPPPVNDKDYIPGYLQTLIGRNVRAEFVVGTNQFVDKTGILREVGTNYFVLEDYISHARIMCDLYSVKFVTAL